MKSNDDPFRRRAAAKRPFGVGRALWVRACVVFLLGAAWGPAAAQTPLDGSWHLTWKGSAAEECLVLYFRDPTICEGSLEMAADQGWLRLRGGGWQTRRDRPCAELKAPVELVDRSPSGATLKVKGSEALRGCSDWVILVRFAEGGGVTAGFPDGRPVELERR